MIFSSLKIPGFLFCLIALFPFTLFCYWQNKIQNRIIGKRSHLYVVCCHQLQEIWISSIIMLWIERFVHSLFLVVLNKTSSSGVKQLEFNYMVISFFKFLALDNSYPFNIEYNSNLTCFIYLQVKSILVFLIDKAQGILSSEY